jgi:UDP-2-acetamido-2,6-beta-L-arabino-hexul-4-ose reductase
MKTVLVTGAFGFIGRNLVATLDRREDIEVLKVGSKHSLNELEEYAIKADFIIHLAGVNRPENIEDFMSGNTEFTQQLIDILNANNKRTPILLSSSIQAEHNNPYGISKHAAEESILNYGRSAGVNTFIYRLPNVFGKWGKPNYNSVIATFCNNIANDIPIVINDPSVIMNLVYVDDVVEEMINVLQGKRNIKENFYEVSVVHSISLGEIVKLIYSFKNTRLDRTIPNMADPLTKKLYSTYLSYLPEDRFSYDLQMNVDDRGSFTEFIKTPDRGQVSVNISKAGITKGNHWHHTKNEKFLVVSGEGVIRFRKVETSEIIEYYVSGEKLKVIDIPVGYTHNIENLGENDMVTIMWANEYFDPEKPDTYYLEV